MLSKLKKVAVTRKSKVAIGAGLILSAGAVMAGAGSTSTDTTFDSALTMLNEFMTGSLGKLLATAMFLGGVAAGVMKQSIWAAVPTIGAALALALAPTVIEEVFVGALPFMI